MDAGAWQLSDSPGAGWGIAVPRKGVRMDPRGWYSFRSCWDVLALGSVLPSTMHRGFPQSGAWESLAAPARGQTDVLQHGTMLGNASIQLEVRTNICCFTRICASGKCTGETGKCCLRSEHWRMAQPHHGCRGVAVAFVGTSLCCSVEWVSMSLASRKVWGCRSQDRDSGFAKLLTWQEGTVPALCRRAHAPVPGGWRSSARRHGRLS